MERQSVRFNGITFRRYPDSPWPAHRNYFTPGIADAQRGIESLHREVWKHHNGVSQIPENHHIHHRDHNTLNNDPDNLELIPAERHLALHYEKLRGCPEFAASQAPHLAKAVEAAKEWHGSEEGKRWHSEHSKRVWENIQYRDHTCEQCGGTYQTRSQHGEERFCSNKCKTAWRYASGVDDEDRECVYCGETFRVNKYRKTRTCGKSCAARQRWVDRRKEAEG